MFHLGPSSFEVGLRGPSTILCLIPLLKDSASSSLTPYATYSGQLSSSGCPDEAGPVPNGFGTVDYAATDPHQGGGGETEPTSLTTVS